MNINTLYLVDSNATELETQVHIKNFQYYQELIEKTKKIQKEININSIFINMSIQCIGIIDFMKDVKLDNQLVQIYLYRLTCIEKLILLTKDTHYKISCVISNMKMDGYTLYDDLIKRISDSNIVNYIIYY